MNITGSHIRRSLRKNEQIKTIIYKYKDKHYSRCSIAQLENELMKLYRKTMGRELDIKHPKTFTEKIQWMKINDCTKEKEQLADKYQVREWVKKTIGEEYLVPLLGVWDDFDDINFDELPDSFCLKMNHGSAMNYLVPKKSEFDKKSAKNLFKMWKARPFYAGSLELHYLNIPRKIIAEKYIEELDGSLYDYKFHCFNGKPLFIQCIGNRDLKEHTGYQNNFDLEWNKLDWIFEDYPSFQHEIEKPKLLDEMISCVLKLSKGFRYVRVDLYEVNGKIYFGEMTFTPASGIYPYKGTWTESMDIRLGQLIPLPEKTTKNLSYEK